MSDPKSPEAAGNPAEVAKAIAKAEVDAYSEGARRAVDAVYNAYKVQNNLMMPGVTPRDGREIISKWVAKGQMNVYDGTEINEWTQQPVFDALATKKGEGRGRDIVRTEVSTLLSAVVSDITSGADPVLESAIAKQVVEKIRFNNELKAGAKKGRGQGIKELPPSKLMTQAEMLKYFGYQNRVKRILSKCHMEGDDFADLESESVRNQLAIVERTILKDTHIDYLDILVTSPDVNTEPLVNNKRKSGDGKEIKKPITSESLKVDLNQELETYRVEQRYVLDQLAAKNDFANMLEEFEAKETGGWETLESAYIMMNQIFSGAKQMLSNCYDLEPLAHLWEGQGRMVDFNPGLMSEFIKAFPEFPEAFRAILAISTGKYALGVDGGVYISGAYGMGYVDKNTGKLVDVDDAWTDKSRRQLKSNIEQLGRDEIWFQGRKVKVVPSESVTRVGLGSGGESKEFYNHSKIGIDESGTTVTAVNRGVVEGTTTEVYLKNFLYDGDVTDKDLGAFVDLIKNFVRAKVPGSDGYAVDLSVGLAKDFCEMSLLSCWFGIPRDSKGRPYYVEYNGKTKVGMGVSADLKKNFGSISSDPDSEAVRHGIIMCGTDESTYNPKAIIDYGKLLMTRMKQEAELYKGRSHGLDALIPFLPENLAVPMIEMGLVSKLIESDGRNGNMGAGELLSKVFDDQKSIMKLKSFWLGLAKSISVYETVSSYFVGDKDPLKVDADLISFITQPRNLEKLTKNIDLSVLYADRWEAARLKINIITAALAVVSKDLMGKKYVGLAPTGVGEGRLDDFLFDVKKKNVEGNDTSTLEMALRQLETSKFVGNIDDIFKILNHISDYSLGKKNGAKELCFTMSEFKRVFGSDFLDRVWTEREQRRRDVLAFN